MNNEQIVSMTQKSNSANNNRKSLEKKREREIIK